MKTIQEHLRECDRESVINIYINNCLKNSCIYQHQDRTITELRERYKEKLNGLIDRLISVEPVFKDERMIFVAAHYSPEDDGNDIRFMLLKEQEIYNDEWATPYGYEFTPFEEAVGFYVADTYLTLLELDNLLATFLYEVSFTGFEQENLEKTINDIKESAEDAKKRKGDPDCFITHEEFTARLEEVFGIEFEKNDPEQSAAWKCLMKQICEYNRICQQIELKKVRKLLDEEEKTEDASLNNQESVSIIEGKEKRMSNFRINYIDACDKKYKSLEMIADNETKAISDMHRMYGETFKHHIVEIIKLNESLPNHRMRIGRITPSTPAPAVSE